MHWLALAVGCLVVSFVSPSAAQDGPVPDRGASDSTDALVLDHDFTAGSGEFVRVFLQAKQVYRAELSTQDVTIGIRSPFRKKQLPRVYPLLDSSSPSGGSTLEIYPDRDDEYELRAIASRGGGVATRLRLYRDVRESRRRMAIIDEPGWGAGVEVASGWHSGLAQGEAGSEIEACFTARRATGRRSVNICALGVGWASEYGAPSTLWVFTEPRLSLFGNFKPGQSNWEMGGLFRFGIGSGSRSSETLVMLAPGVYVARHLRTDQDGSGWSLHASYSFASFLNTPKAPDGSTPTASRLLLGVGWYQ